MPRRWKGGPPKARRPKKTTMTIPSKSNNDHVVPAPSDPNADALTLYLLHALCVSAESAGVVRDLVHGHITDNASCVYDSQKLFETAMDRVPHATKDVSGAFFEAFESVRNMPIPGIHEIKEIIFKEVDIAVSEVDYHGMCHAAAEALTARFPHTVHTAIQTRAPLPNKAAARFPQSRSMFMLQDSRIISWSSQPDFLKMAELVTKIHDSKISQDTSKRDLEQACKTMVSRIVREATSPDLTFALCAAASAVMVQALFECNPKKYMGTPIRDDCDQLAWAISDAGGLSLEKATIITDGMLEGALQYRRDPDQAAGEVAVRAIRTAHMWVSMRVGVVMFHGLFGLLVGAAWAASSDKDRFEDMYKTALEAAGDMDPDIHYLFNPLLQFISDSKFDELDTQVRDFFYGASGYTLDEWAKMVQELNYKDAALLPENAPLMKAYRSKYEAVKCVEI